MWVKWIRLVQVVPIFRCIFSFGPRHCLPHSCMHRNQPDREPLNQHELARFELARKQQSKTQRDKRERERQRGKNKIQHKNTEISQLFELFNYVVSHLTVDMWLPSCWYGFFSIVIFQLQCHTETLPVISEIGWLKIANGECIAIAFRLHRTSVSWIEQKWILIPHHLYVERAANTNHRHHHHHRANKKSKMSTRYRMRDKIEIRKPRERDRSREEREKRNGRNDFIILLMRNNVIINVRTRT